MSTALLKVLGLALNAPILLQTDPLTGLSFQVLLLAALVAEITLIVISFSFRMLYAAGLVVFGILVVNFRLLGIATNSLSCPCLGGLSRWWPWLELHEPEVLLTVASWLTLAGLAQMRLHDSESPTVL